MSERITQELRKAMNVEREYAMDGDVVVRMYCMGRDEFANLCDNIDAVHANLERENESLRRELDRVLGELDEVHKTDGLSDNSGGFMHDEKRSIGSAVVTITDELRKWASVEVPYKYGHQLNAIADRIDAEHERQLEVLYRDMSDAEWVRLPVDADGEPIHAGDVLDGYGKTIEVVELRHGRSGWVLISRDGNGYADTFAFTHHHVDSWERIINDAVNVHGNGFNPCWTDERDALVARCKALAGDAE